MGRASVGSRNRRRHNKGKKVKDKTTGELMRRTQLKERLRSEKANFISNNEEE